MTVYNEYYYYYYYYYKCIDLSDTVTQALQGHCTHNE